MTPNCTHTLVSMMVIYHTCNYLLFECAIICFLYFPIVLLLAGPSTNGLMIFYSGHGGRQIVEFLEKNLEQTLAEEIQQITPKGEDESTMAERIARAFLITDMQSRQLERNTAGATAVAVLIKSQLDSHGNITQRILHVANVGDSRAVLVSEKFNQGK